MLLRPPLEIARDFKPQQICLKQQSFRQICLRCKKMWNSYSVQSTRCAEMIRKYHLPQGPAQLSLSVPKSIQTLPLANEVNQIYWALIFIANDPSFFIDSLQHWPRLRSLLFLRCPTEVSWFESTSSWMHRGFNGRILLPLAGRILAFKTSIWQYVQLQSRTSAAAIPVLPHEGGVPRKESWRRSRCRVWQQCWRATKEQTRR